MAINKYLVFSEEVLEAKKVGAPIVALESTIISHGMPYPQNVETARRVEEIIREQGAVPATMAIMDGKIKVGLSDDELERLAKEENVVKMSRRDFPAVLSYGKTGATTVAATMICAQLAGIEVFVTGGIGGVHRGAETTMDISADLQELANTNVAVVCAGAKSILDIGLTLEYLETHGVPVIGYKTEDFPAFYTRKSGFSVDVAAQSPKEVAEILKVKWELGLKGGAVIGNPVPEQFEMDEEKVTANIEAAVKEAVEKGISGKETTPFLLSRLEQMSEGETLKTNIALVENNARVGAKIAIELNELRKSES